MAEQEYKCIRKCYFGKGDTVAGKAPARRVYLFGELEKFDPAIERVPRHFVPVSEFQTVRPEEPFKPIIKGLRAPVDPDQLEKVETEKKKRRPSRPIDAHKDEDFFGSESKTKK